MTSEGRARELEFHDEMVELYRRAKKEAGYNATYFLGMLGEVGGYETAKYLLRTDRPSEGYVALYELGRLDLTVEAVVVRPEWADLFTEHERSAARNRLRDYGFDVDRFIVERPG